MSFVDKFNRISSDMAMRSYQAYSNGQSDNEADLFRLLQYCFATQNMKSIRLSEIPTMFKDMYSRPLSTQHLIDLLKSPNISLMCTVKQVNQVIIIEPTSEFAKMNEIVQEMRRKYVEPVIKKEAEAQRRQSEAQTKNNRPSTAETDAHLKNILPDNTPLEQTPHYKMFVVEFSETLRMFFDDIDMGTEDHLILLWLYLIHLFTISKKKYRVSVSELPELFREFYGQTLELPDKLVATLQENCYLVCQVEKFKNDWHVKPSEELVLYLSTPTGEELQEVISENLKILRGRHNSDYNSSDDDLPVTPVQKPVPAQKKQQAANNKNKQQSNNSNNAKSVQRPNEPFIKKGFFESQPTNSNTNANKSGGSPKQNNNSKPVANPNQQQAPKAQQRASNTHQASPLVLNGTDIGTYGNKGRELAMQEHIENERTRLEQTTISDKQTSQESSNKATSKSGNKKGTGQWVKKSEVSNTNNTATSSPQPENEKDTAKATSPAPTPSPQQHTTAPPKQQPAKEVTGAEELAETVALEFSCNTCHQILRRPVESTCCHKLVCYTCSLFNGLCPFCQRPGRRVEWAENHVVNHLMSQLTIKCPYKQCNDWVLLNDFFVHKEHCNHRPSPCPNKSCGASKHYSELEAHINTCPFTLITCACKQQVKRKDMESHLATCKKRHITGSSQLQQH